MTRNPIPPTGSHRLPRLYTVAQTAAYAQTSEKSAPLVDQRSACHRLGRQIRIAEADLLAFIAARRQQ